jgi:hypothetical protein
MDESDPIQSWNLTAYHKDWMKSISISYVKWYPKRSSAFIAVDSVGCYYFFDLLKNPFGPITIQNVAIEGKLNNKLIDISNAKSWNNIVYTVVAPQNLKLHGIDGLQATKLNEDFAIQNDTKSDNNIPLTVVSVHNIAMLQSENMIDKNDVEEILLRQSMTSWMKRTIAPKYVASITHDSK